jgi:hypothetical protein
MLQSVSKRPLRLIMGDLRKTVVVKVIRADSTESLNVQQLLGQRPWPCGSLSMQSLPASERLWETLHLVPLALDGLMVVPEYPDLVAVVMRRLVPLAALSSYLSDIAVLLHVAAQLVEVRHLVHLALDVPYRCWVNAADVWWALLLPCAVQILDAWRRVGLIHGDIKPENIVVQLPPPQSRWTRPSGVYYRQLKVFLIDVEGMVHLPLRTTSDGGRAGAVPYRIVLVACGTPPLYDVTFQ